MKLADKQKGILLMLATSFSFAFMQINVAWSGANIPIMEQLFFRNILLMLFCPFLLKKQRQPLFGTKEQQPLLFIRSIAGLLSTVMLFYAVQHAPQASVSILSKTAPFLITLWAYLFLKEELLKVQIPALIIAFTGALIVLNPVFNKNIGPLLIALLCAVLSSVSYILLAYFKNKVHPFTIIMHFSTLCVAVSLPFIAANPVIPLPRDLLFLLGVGFFGSLGQVGLTYSYILAPAAEISVYSYSGIIFSALLGFFCLGEALKPGTVAGGLMIIASGLLVYFYARPKHAHMDGHHI